MKILTCILLTHMYLEHFLYFQIVTVRMGGCLEFYQQKLNTKLMDISVPVILDVPKHLIQKCHTKMLTGFFKT